ncbi:Putative ribonuclease H protein At1g65750 [Linum perenne]
MQTSVLPISTCDEIDKRIRNFVWGSTSEERKVHLVSWDHICKPKNQGGLGLRLARHLNTAYLIKLAFQFFQKPDLLWVQLLHTKYFKEINGELKPRNRNSQSAVWRGLTKAWPLMLEGARASIRNGQGTAFWTARWLDSGTKLIDHVATHDDNIDLQASVRDLVMDSMSPPSSDQGDDEWVWSKEISGKFSIRTAYDIVINSPNLRPDVNWSMVWRWSGPGRVQYFLWLLSHGKILTNAERKVRHMTEDESCPRCRAAAETILHTLRDCPFASNIWNLLGYNIADPLRQQITPNNWIKLILTHEKSLELGIVIWFLWKARNDWVFNDTNDSASSLVVRIRNWTMTVMNASAQQEIIGAKNHERIRTDVAWEPGEAGWVVLNTDGSVIPGNSMAAAGGLIRTNDGRGLLAYCVNLGKCSIMRAELRGVIEGLRLAWNHGYRKVAVRVDSRAILSLVNGVANPSHLHAREATDIREFFKRDWEVTITHVYREGNVAADFLANLGHKYPHGLHLISLPDCNLSYFLRRDCMGISEPRLIPR